MKMRFGLFLMFSVLLTLTACAGRQAEFSTYVMPDVIFKGIKSYQWQEPRPETAMMQAKSEMIHRLIVQTIDEELAADGLQKKDGGDVLVSYRVTVSPQKGFWQSLFAAESVTPGTYNRRSAEAQAEAIEERSERKGVLVIEMRDRKGTLLWSVRASAIVSETSPGRVVEAVRKIMAEYPPLSS